MKTFVGAFAGNILATFVTSIVLGVAFKVVLIATIGTIICYSAAYSIRKRRKINTATLPGSFILHHQL